MQENRAHSPAMTDILSVTMNSALDLPRIAGLPVLPVRATPSWIGFSSSQMRCRFWVRLQLNDTCKKLLMQYAFLF